MYFITVFLRKKKRFQDEEQPISLANLRLFRLTSLSVDGNIKYSVMVFPNRTGKSRDDCNDVFPGLGKSGGNDRK